jgi:hypothetical protein
MPQVLNAADKMTAIEVIKLTEGSADPFLVMDYLKQTNELLADIPAVRCNDGTGHKLALMETGDRPKGAHRTYYQGTPDVMVHTGIRRETTTTIEAWSKVDEMLAGDSGAPDRLRNSVASRVITGIGEQQTLEFIYGRRKGATDPYDTIDGLATRLNKADGKNVFSMGGTGANLTSIYMAAAGENYFHLIYPQYGEGTVGVSREDKGKQTVEDEKGDKYDVYLDKFRVRHGIAIPNPGAVKRICNIAPDVNREDLMDKILAVMRRMPLGAPTYVIYANYMVQDIFDKAARVMDNIVRQAEDPWGKTINTIRGYRIRTVQAIREDEAVVPAA